MRNCQRCGNDKPEDHFPGQAQRCLECRKQARREIQQRQRQRLAAMPNRICPGCREDLPKARFSGGNTLCRDCHNDYNKRWRSSSPKARLSHLHNTARNNVRALGLPFDITPEHLCEIWSKQGGLCYYTGEPLTFSGDRSNTAVSLDRKVPEKGYVQGNVVLACWGFNRMKTDLTMQELKTYCRSFLARHGGGT